MLKRLTNLLKMLGCIFLITSASLTQAVDETDTGVEMHLKQVSENVYFAEGAAGIATDNAGFISNAGVVISNDGIVIFDALGSPALAKQLLGEIRKISQQPIKAVVVSHYHADHFYGLQTFVDEGAEVIAPLGASAYLESDTANNRLEERRVSLDPWVNDDTRLIVPDRLVETSQTLEVGALSLEIINVGAAHSEGDLTMLVEPDGVLFSGDIIFEGRIPFVGNGDTRNWLAVLDRLSNNEVAAIVPGHGGTAKDPQGVLRLTHDYLRILREKMGAAVDEFEPFADAYDAVDWSDFWELPAFAEANRGNAYGVYLSMEREALE